MPPTSSSAGATAGDAVELRILTPVAIKPLLTKIVPEFERATGAKIVVIWGESGSIKTDIENGVAFDIAVLTPNFVDDLIGQGRLDGATRTVIAKSGLGVVIRQGAPKPDIGTTDAFKRALVAAKSIGIVEHSASSRYLAGLFDRLGIAGEIASKLTSLPGPAAQFVATGDPELAVTQIAAILPAPGVALAGPLPPDIQLFTVFIAAASPAAHRHVRALLDALVSPSNAALLTTAGLEPA
jgi:molybdate transport system substrate-binding protein